MKVVLFHPVKLPPANYGGVERVVCWLAKGLVQRGHEVYVGAHPDSRLPEGVRLIPVAPDRVSALDFLEKIPTGADVVHFMAPPEEGTWERLPCAGVLTVHGNGKPGETFPKNTVFLSNDHARRHGSARFVYNGIDPDEFIYDSRRRRERYLFLSKTSWRVKNVRGAVELCARARVDLDVAGGNRPWDLRARACVSSLMGSGSLRWLGPVANRRKALALAGAKGLVFPVLWDEPFGLVVIESLMSGTPVFASRRGSLPELVPSTVGAILDSPDDWIEALQGRRGRWLSEECREWAMTKFHYLVMTDSYLEIYAEVPK